MTAAGPIARILVDTGLAHLDRPFDYLVPAELSDSAVPGVRVRVRFAGRDVPGLLIERVPESEHRGRLSAIRTVVSAEPVLTEHILATAQILAAELAGTVGDVVRLAIPPRHAAAERALPQLVDEPADPIPPVARAAWERYAAGPAFLDHLSRGGSPAASVLACPSPNNQDDWPQLLAAAAATCAQAGRGAVLVVPDHRDLARVDAALTAALGRGRHVRLSADQGPQARYTAYLKVLRGHVRVVVGTRAAAFAPVHDLGLLAWWDDGDDLHEEPRAPYPHVREVLATRARLTGAALLSVGWSRTATLAGWIADGRMHPVAVSAAERKSSTAAVRIAGEGSALARDPAAAAARIPSVAWEVAKAGLAVGPVLVQVPRRGYLPAMRCQACRSAARCTACSGPLVLTSASGPPSCRWCGRLEVAFTCGSCGEHRLRASVVGSRRTAEELGRAFPGTPVRTSGAGAVLETVGSQSALVVATPGAEPVADGGYAAALLLDAWSLLDRATLDAGEEALRRWLGAASLVRGRDRGGVVVLAGAPTGGVIPAVEALVRWDAGWFAEGELRERTGLALPPTAWVATVTGSAVAVRTAIRDAAFPPEVTVFGPLPHGATGQVRAMVCAPLSAGMAAAAALRSVRASASARKDPDNVTVVVMPRDPTS